MSQGPVLVVPESGIPLDPELPEPPLEPELPLDPELLEPPLEPELPLDPELLEPPLEPLPLDPDPVPLEPPLEVEPLEPVLPSVPEADPLLACDAPPSGEEFVELSLLEPQPQRVAVAAATAKKVRARMRPSFFPLVEGTRCIRQPLERKMPLQKARPRGLDQAEASRPVSRILGGPSSRAHPILQ
jgi:hypothetical protein